jgi:hypothetical protein
MMTVQVVVLAVSSVYILGAFSIHWSVRSLTIASLNILN